MTGSAPAIGPLHYTFKIASRCNLDCSYCYVYHQADSGWRDKPPLMSDAVVEAAAIRIRRHARAAGQSLVRIVFHGGEPLLAGRARFDRWCRMLRAIIEPAAQVRLTLQTNGVLLDAQWAELLARHRVGVGISLDGSAASHDRNRVDHKGRGSHAAVCRGIAALHAARMPVHLLTVIDLDSDPLDTHRHLLGHRPQSIDYLFPDQTHMTIADLRATLGPTPCADFLTPIFDWWLDRPGEVDISPLKAIAEAVLGGVPAVDFIGNRPFGYLFVETDGSIEGLDVLRVCAAGAAGTGLTVFDHDFIDLQAEGSFHARAIFDGFPLPAACTGCVEAQGCAGGYLPHRFDGQGYDNRSAWCADLLALFGHVRDRFGIAPDQTLTRRAALARMLEGVGEC